MSQPYCEYDSYESSLRSSAATARAVVMDGLPDERRTSPIRRTFLLFILFDFVGIFILWVLFTQLMLYPSIVAALQEEVVHYHFKTSMFDMVILAFWRLLVLELSYGLLKFNQPWSAAVATTGTCIVCLVKIFYYDFQHKNVKVKGYDVFDYVIVICSFVLTWLETWFLDFRVLPKEKAARQIGDIDERTSLLRSHRTMPADFAPSERYFSPSGSSSESEAGEINDLINFNPTTAVSANGFNIEKALQEADSLFTEAVRLIDHVVDWNLDSKKANTGSVFTNRSERGKTIYKFTGIVDCPPMILYNDMVEEATKSPAWNLSLAECRRIQKLNDNTDVLYNIVKDQLAGAVSSRDFVILRRWGPLPDGRLLVASKSTVHPECPTVRQHVRGENGPTGVMMESITVNNREQTNFKWVLDSNIKGWIPQRLVDQAMVGVLHDVMEAMNGHAKDICGFVSIHSSVNNIDDDDDDDDDGTLQFLSSRSSPS